MDYFALIVGALKEIFGSFRLFDKWFRKSTSEKLDKKKSNFREKLDKSKKTGRPEW